MKGVINRRAHKSFIFWHLNILSFAVDIVELVTPLLVSSANHFVSICARVCMCVAEPDRRHVLVLRHAVSVLPQPDHVAVCRPQTQGSVPDCRVSADCVVVGNELCPGLDPPTGCTYYLYLCVMRFPVGRSIERSAGGTDCRQVIGSGRLRSPVSVIICP